MRGLRRGRRAWRWRPDGLPAHRRGRWQHAAQLGRGRAGCRGLPPRVGGGRLCHGAPPPRRRRHPKSSVSPRRDVGPSPADQAELLPRLPDALLAPRVPIPSPAPSRSAAPTGGVLDQERVGVQTPQDRPHRASALLTAGGRRDPGEAGPAEHARGTQSTCLPRLCRDKVTNVGTAETRATLLVSL